MVPHVCHSFPTYFTLGQTHGKLIIHAQMSWSVWCIRSWKRRKENICGQLFYNLTSIHIFPWWKNKHNYVSTSHYVGLHKCAVEQYDHDVSNQWDATTFPFINLFNSALHVSGKKFTHPHERFMTVQTAFGTMHRHCCWPVPRLRQNSSISTVAPVSRSVDALYQKLYIQSERTPEDGRICRPKHVGLN